MSEFAKLSPIQLLEETEKAVGDPDLPVQHQQLVERSKQLKALEVVKPNLAPFDYVPSKFLKLPLLFQKQLGVIYYFILCSILGPKANGTDFEQSESPQCSTRKRC